MNRSIKDRSSSYSSKPVHSIFQMQSSLWQVSANLLIQADRIITGKMEAWGLITARIDIVTGQTKKGVTAYNIIADCKQGLGCKLMLSIKEEVSSPLILAIRSLRMTSLNSSCQPRESGLSTPSKWSHVRADPKLRSLLAANLAMSCILSLIRILKSQKT